MAGNWSADDIEDLACHMACQSIRIFCETKHLQKKTLRQFVNEQVHQDKFLRGIFHGGQYDHLKSYVQIGIDDAISNYYERRQQEPEVEHPWGYSWKRGIQKKEKRNARRKNANNA